MSKGSMPTKSKTVVAGALGECVHVAGVLNFLDLARAAGWNTIFLGPATPVSAFIAAAQQSQADLVGVSYRLTAETGERLLAEFAEAADELRSAGVRFAFGGTPPVVAHARALGFFERLFQGGEPPEIVLAYLKGQAEPGQAEMVYPQTAVERISWKHPYPLLRHHFGLPSLADTRDGIAEIAAANVLDVISLGIDQDAQENFFHPERQELRRRGAGGAPLRSAGDYQDLYAAAQRGNYPLLRTYSGTDDFLRLAEMYTETIHIAWCAIPLFWFNRMDGRGPWDLEGSIRQHQSVMAWYGARGIPVELNEPHHWGLRSAPDVVCAASAYLSAYNARACGVGDYIGALMFNSPPGLSEAMDLAKMLAIRQLVAPLAGPGFHLWWQTRTGLLSYPLEPAAARAHLATSVYLQMALRPHIVHVVGFSEADHAATAQEVIEGCQLARRAIRNALNGQPDLLCEPQVQARARELVAETRLTLQAITDLAPPGTHDPLTDPATLTRAVTSGILDAPQLRGNPFARGQVQARILGGACLAVDAVGKPLAERQRLADLLPRKENAR